MTTYNIQPYTSDVAVHAECDSSRPFAIAVRPPIRDGNYCTINTAYRLGGSAVSATTPNDATDIMERAIEQWRDSYDDEHGKITTKPTPDTVSFFIHPAFDGEVSPSDAFGTATLGDFATPANQDEAEDTPWCADQPAYDDYITPLLDASAPSETVLWFRHDKGTSVVQTWVGTTSDGDLVQYTYTEIGNKTDGPVPVDKTQLVHTLGDTTRHTKQLLDVEWRDRSTSPFTDAFQYPYLDDEHPREVNGWEFDPDVPKRADSWASPDGTLAVNVYGGGGRPGQIRVADLRFSSTSDEFVPDGLPGTDDESDLTLDEARAAAVEWMRKTDPETWEHPYTNDELTAYTPPAGYSAADPSVTDDSFRMKLTATTTPDEYDSLTVQVRGENVTGGTVGEHTILVSRTPASDGWNRPEREEHDVTGSLTKVLSELDAIAARVIPDSTDEPEHSEQGETQLGDFTAA